MNVTAKAGSLPRFKTLRHSPYRCKMGRGSVILGIPITAQFRGHYRKGTCLMPIEAIPMSQSRTKTTKLVMPPDTNHHGTIFGGQVLSYLDEISAIAAMKHAGAAVVTASIDSVDFVSPATVGEVLEIEAVVTSTGRTSMEVFVTVHSIDLLSSARKLTTESFVTMVAMDEENRPTPVAPVYPETKAEKALYDKAPARRANRKERMAIKDAL